MRLIAQLAIVGCLLFSVTATAQEQLTDLSFNQLLVGYYKQFYKQHLSMKAGNDTLSLPFFEDFTKDYHYPDPDKWSDVNAFVNRGLPINPRSYGVATLDGVDSTGYPYNFGDPFSYGEADRLTSKKIRLQGAADSVYFSFFYQPEGHGNKPEEKDSLVLDFYRSDDSTWVRQWAVPGTGFHSFKQVMLFVDTIFQTDGFQFRFRNYATLSGNVDHWHVDYIYLNGGRNHNDTIYNDVVYKNPHVSFLQNYEAMPWWHYKADTINNMADEVNLRVYNYNPGTGYAVNYKYTVHDQSGALVETQPIGDPFFTLNTALDSTDLPNEIYKPSPPGPTANDFYFPPNDSNTTYFVIRNFFALDKTTTPKFDFHLPNDTIVSFQTFGDYYAYDDGSAERGYGVHGINSELAYRFSSKIQDTLGGVRIYFNPIKDNATSASFKLKVWNSSRSQVIYEEPFVVSPLYSFFNQFITYKFSSPVVVSGTFHIGYEKITEPIMNIGYDRNLDNSSNLFINTNGSWAQSGLKGSLMLRPFFRNGGHVIAGTNEEVVQDFSVSAFPNPSNGAFSIRIDGAASAQYQIVIHDLSGKLIASEVSGARASFVGFSEGMYLVSATDIQTGNTHQTKIVIAR